MIDTTTKEERKIKEPKTLGKRKHRETSISDPRIASTQMESLISQNNCKETERFQSQSDMDAFNSLCERPKAPTAKKELKN